MDQAQALTAQFYAWESRGRGWQLWNEPVILEPPFVPFIRCLPPSGHANDNRRPTIISSLVDRLRGRTAQALWDHSEEITEYLAQYDREPQLDDWIEPDDLSEIQILLPAGFKSPRNVAQEFLLCLGYGRQPVAFEIIGLPDAVVLQVACRASDEEQILQQLRIFYPEAVLEQQSDFLLHSWLAGEPEDEEDEPNDRIVIDFGLSNEFMLPLRTAKDFDVDPLASIIGGLENLRRDEIGVCQIILQPVRFPWAENIFRAVTDGDGKPFFCDAPEIVGLTKQKIGSPLFAAAVRLAGKSPRRGRAMDIARSMGAGLAQLANPMANEVIPLTNDDYDDEWHERDLICRQTHRSGMILSADELLALVHLPGPFVRSEKLKRLSQKTKAAPGIAVGQGFTLGTNQHNGETVEVSLSPAQRVRHMHVIGASGTGKSTFLLNLIMQDIERGEGVAVLDPHGDLIDQVLARLPRERFDDVVLVDPSDADYPVGFNILQAHSELEKNLLASDLVGIFRRLATSWGDQMTSVLGNAVIAFLESSTGGTLADLRRFLVDQNYRKQFVKTVQDPEVAYYWQKEFPLLSGKPQAPILTRLDTFLRPKLIRYMVSQKENRLDFGGIMNRGQIFLAKLSQGAIGEENAYLLGSLIVSKLHQLALCRQEVRASERRPFYLYIDEFMYFVTPSMASILSGVRKYQLGLVLAHQEMRQLGKDSEIASAILANPYTRICFRLGDQDAAKLASGFSFFDAKDLQNLGTGEAIARIERAEYDFNLRIEQLPEINASEAEDQTEELIRLSRGKHATPRLEVEALLVHARGTDTETRAESVTESESPAPKEKKPRRQTATEVPREEVPSPSIPTEPVETSSPPPPIPSPTIESVTPASELPHMPRPVALGRGGPKHRYLQQLIKQWAEGMGWRATMERPVGDGEGSIDVALEKEGRSIACEISVSTDPKHELENVRKCLGAGFDHVVVVSTEAARLEALRVAIIGSIPVEQAGRVQVCTPEGLFAFVEDLEASLHHKVETVKGYRVTLNVTRVDSAEHKAKEKAIGEVIGKSLMGIKKARKKK